jgi:Neuraminidase (sialidase)
MAVAWADMRNGDADILASSSTDGGQTWSEPVRINHDPLGNGTDHFQPAVAVAPNGTYTCAWFDRRYDLQNRLIDEEIAQSTDDGATWGRNIRVTKHSWNPAIDAPEPEGKPTNTFIGDYQALAADNRTVHPLWNDTQNGISQEIETAVLSVRIFAR